MQDLTLTFMMSIGGWLPRELTACAGLTALRLRDCRSHEDATHQWELASDPPPHRLPVGVYLQTLQELHLVDCQFAAFPVAVSEATALRSLVCSNNAVRRLPTVPSTPFKADHAAVVLGCLPQLSQLRFRASDWDPEQRHSLPYMLPDACIDFAD